MAMPSTNYVVLHHIHQFTQKSINMAKKTGKPDNSPAAVKAAQANHENYKWFDIFEADPVKKAYHDPLLNELKAVSIAFVLGKKLKPVFIEPELAMGQGG